MVLAPRSTRGFQKKGDLHDALTPALTRKMVIESCSVGEMGALGQVGAVRRPSALCGRVRRNSYGGSTITGRYTTLCGGVEGQREEILSLWR